jgi:hypothetical protein
VDLLHGVQMMGAKKFPSPCVSGSKLSKLDRDPLSDASEYRNVVGDFMGLHFNKAWNIFLCQLAMSTYALPNNRSLDSGETSPKILQRKTASWPFLF